MKNKENKSGFTLPEGYFESFQERLMQRLGEPEASWPRTEGFEVPEGYFDKLGERIASRVSTQEPRVVEMKAYRKYWLAAAAVAAIAMLFFLLPSSETSQPSFDDLASSDITFYMESSEVEFTDDEIAQLIPVQELEISDMFEQALTEEHILEYLDTSMDDYEEINFETNE